MEKFGICLEVREWEIVLELLAGFLEKRKEAENKFGLHASTCAAETAAWEIKKMLERMNVKIK